MKTLLLKLEDLRELIDGNKVYILLALKGLGSLVAWAVGDMTLEALGTELWMLLMAAAGRSAVKKIK